MITDTVGDFLTSIRNGVTARHKKVDVPASKMRVAIVDILKNKGFVKNYKLFKQDNKGVLRVYLRYVDKNRSIIQGLERVSKPSRRVYVSHKQMTTVLSGIGIGIVSTSKGLMSDDLARESRLGGEYICRVW